MQDLTVRRARVGETEPRVVTVFRSRLRGEHEHEYSEMAARMEAIASAMPGFVEIKGFTAEDGERVSLVTFASMRAHEAWRDHPEHRAAQRMGRDLFYSEYRIVVCEEIAERSFVRDDP